MFYSNTQEMKESINHFSLADLKRHMGIEDGLNNHVLIHDFAVENNTRKSPTSGRADAIGIVMCHEGEISATINSRDFLLKSGMAAMILPNCIYDLTPSGTAARGTIFAVSASLLKDMHIDIRQMIPFGMHVYHNPCFHFSEPNMALYNRYIEMMRMVSQRDKSHSLPVVQGLLASMMAFIFSKERAFSDRATTIPGFTR